uniref:Protein kinase domain-containing protein n=1 Tax=Amphiprion percula TaxID=161767 RepID=A0A3P8SQT7_AMPPE
MCNLQLCRHILLHTDQLHKSSAIPRDATQPVKSLHCRHETFSMAKELKIKKGSRLGSCHVVEDILGEGSFGIVAKCRNTETTKIEAVKVNKSEEGVLEVAMDEIAILKRLRRLNPDTCNIVQCNGFFFDKENICISFELLDLSLQDYLQEKNPRGLTTRELRPILHQLATALSHLHSSGIIHADLKPVNVMVVNRHEQPLKVKLIDFGVARLVSAVNQGDWMGTLHYSAPEMLLGVPFNESVDMWALGLLMVELATGCQLYPGKTEYDVLRFIFETMKLNSLNDIEKYMVQDPGYEEDQKIFVSLIKSMLSLDAGRRITAQEVLEHRFFAPSLHQNSTDFSARSPVPPLSALRSTHTGLIHKYLVISMQRDKHVQHTKLCRFIDIQVMVFLSIITVQCRTKEASWMRGEMSLRTKNQAKSLQNHPTMAKMWLSVLEEIYILYLSAKMFTRILVCNMEI